jgi:hypothetical protein
MATRISGPSGPRTRRTGEVCLPACPACGGLECLCRPRFFAGQLLTEQELNRLDRYIREKNRLHNRHLHGWGAVCGLEVTCDDCENQVRVSAGYGLSPCGDDIVVCESVPVDVCALIRRCSDQERRHRDCEAPQARDRNCDEGDETWVLAICYDEKPSRGVTALRSSGCACSKCSGTKADCGCGGGGTKRSGGCGCNGNGNGNGHGHGHAHDHGRGGGRRPAAQCEPTLICEGYRFEVYRAPVGDEARNEAGALGRRAQECLRPYLDFAREVGAGMPASTPSNRDQQQRLCCAMKDRLREILRTRPIHNCDSIRRLNEIVCPRPDTQDFDGALARTMREIVLVWFEGLMACICSTLLPPCPKPADDNCIPLATVTVRRQDCRIRRVCNWSVHRKFATNIPAMQYWLSILPFGRMLRQLIEQTCCHLLDRFREPARETPTPTPNQPPTTGPAPGIPGSAPFAFSSTGPTSEASTGRPEETAQPFFRTVDTAPFATKRSRETSDLIADALLGRATPLDPERVFAGFMAAGRRDPEAPIKEREMENLPQYLMAGELMLPWLRGMVPDDLTGASGAMATFSALSMAGAGGGKAEVETMRHELSEMRSTLQRQQETIERLNARLDKNP